MLSGFLPGGAASSGWTSYPPLSVVATTGQTVWLIGMVFNNVIFAWFIKYNSYNSSA